MKYEPTTVGKNWEQRGMSDRQKKAEHAGAIMIALERKRESDRMKDKYENPKKYKRDIIAHLFNKNTGRYDAKSSPQDRQLKEKPKASSPFGEGPNKSKHPKGWYDRD